MNNPTLDVVKDQIIDLHGEKEVKDENPVEKETEKTPEQIESEKKAATEKEETQRKNHNQRRWENHIKRTAAAEARAELLEKQLAEATASKQQQQAADSKPIREHFNTDADFTEALTDWKIAQRMPEIESKIQAKHEESKVTSTWQHKESEVRKSHPDYDEVVEDATDVIIPQAAIDAIVSSDLGPEIRYYLAKNPDDAAKINGMSPIAAIREIGRIESRIEAEKTKGKKPAKVSDAPDPIKPIGGESGGSDETDINKMTTDQYMKWREKHPNKKR